MMKDDDGSEDETTNDVISDEHLMERFQNGDEDAFCILYKKYWEKTGEYLSVLFNMYNIPQDDQLKKDLHQTIFTAIYKKKHGYDKSKAKFITYIITIGRNALINYMKKTGPEDPLPPDIEGENTKEKTGRMIDFFRCLRKLSEKQQNMFLKMKVFGYTVNELIESTDMSEHAVKKSIYRMNMNIKECMG